MTAWDEYLAIEATNWSRLRSMRVSPLQYRYDVEHPQGDSEPMRIGRAIHTLVLEPHKWDAEYVVWEGTRRGKAWDAFAAENSDRTILNTKECERATQAAAAVKAHPIAQQYVRGGKQEQTLTWTDADTGILCKCRVDQIGGRLVELKSTNDVIPRKFAVHAQRLGYHCQLAFYSDGLDANGYQLKDDPAMIVVQSGPPYDVVPYLVPDDVVSVGRHEYKELLHRLKWCRDNDCWPGVADDREQILHLPAWAYSSDDNEPITIGGAEVL